MTTITQTIAYTNAAQIAEAGLTRADLTENSRKWSVKNLCATLESVSEKGQFIRNVVLEGAYFCASIGQNENNRGYYINVFADPCCGGRIVSRRIGLDPAMSIDVAASRSVDKFEAVIIEILEELEAIHSALKNA